MRTKVSQGSSPGWVSDSWVACSVVLIESFANPSQGHPCLGAVSTHLRFLHVSVSNFVRSSPNCDQFLQSPQLCFFVPMTV